MSAQRSRLMYCVVVAAVVVTFVVSQLDNGSLPSATEAVDVTVLDARRPPPSAETSSPAPAPAPRPSTPTSTTTTLVASTTSVVTTTTALVTTTTVLGRTSPAPAEAGVAAPVRGEQIQLTEPIPAPATTTTEPPPPPTTVRPNPPQSQPPTQPNPTTAPPATQPPAPPPPASTSSDAIALTNQARANAGLAALSSNGALNSAAASHSADQAAMNQMTHTGSNGSNAGDRIRAAGYSPGTWGENVAAGYGSSSAVVAGWMGSSGHRANILNSAFTQIGVASATSANGTRYWTMVLAG